MNYALVLGACQEMSEFRGHLYEQVPVKREAVLRLARRSSGGRVSSSGLFGIDAWNRLVEVWEDADGDETLDDPGDTAVQVCRYDGLGRRIRKIVAGDPDITYDYYHSGYQVVEVRQDGDADPLEQYVWDGRYVHSPCLRWRDGNTDGDLDDEGDSVLYYTNDANFNVTALVDASDGSVVERVVYDPYGQPTFYDGAWENPSASSAYANDILFTGHPLDAETGLYHTLHRPYHPTLGRWLQRDPIGYKDGMSLYEYAQCGPITTGDPFGLRVDYGRYHPDVDVRQGRWYQEGRYNTEGKWEKTGTQIKESDYSTYHKGGWRGRYRRIKNCHVLVILTHGTQIFWAIEAHHLNCAAFGVLTCGADAPTGPSSQGGPMNYATEPREGPHPTYDDLGTRQVPKPGLIDGFPMQPGGIGASNLAGNAGRGGGKAAFRQLLDDAWDKAVEQGEKFAKSEHCCFCKEIVVVFRIEGRFSSLSDKGSLEVVDNWNQLPSPDVRVKKIPVEGFGQ